ncbi:hypothetical protein LWI28_002322 [Acer negundo]|uniref:VQ domain-containing protein n=1 Tax=Acer negundo TaxID=4023 RepID=A0AAD5ND51_ACENE|nr:hypothetical protein LWI28_002322 [Acer negundo]KAK4834702.1 hypothetical protein QYF36_027103 [Acer negundo]
MRIRRSSLTEEGRNKLQGPRPAPLKVKSRFSSTVIKKELPIRQRTSPVIVYLASPKIIHVKPHEFMGLVQRLTGRELPTDSSLSSSSCVMENNKSMMINHEAAGSYADHHQAACVPPSNSNLLAAFPGLCKDIYANWDQF